MIKVALIGCGYWGPNLLRNILNSSKFSLEAVVDKDVDRLNKINTGSASKYSSIDELNFSNLDAAIIATPPHTHYEIAKKCLDNGLHCMVEKPFTLNSSHATELALLAKQKNLTLMPGYTFLYNDAVAYVKEKLDSNSLGDLLFVRSQRLSLGLYQSKTNVAWDLAPHDLAILLYWFGRLPNKVSATGHNYYGKYEDIVNITLYFDQKICTIQSSWLDPKKIREMTLVGSQKMLVYDDTHPGEKIKIIDKKVSAPDKTDNYYDWQVSYHYGSTEIPYLKVREPLSNEINHFADFINKDQTIEFDAFFATRILNILETVDESLKRKGDCLDINYSV